MTSKYQQLYHRFYWVLHLSEQYFSIKVLQKHSYHMMRNRIKYKGININNSNTNLQSFILVIILVSSYYFSLVNNRFIAFFLSSTYFLIFCFQSHHLVRCHAISIDSFLILFKYITPGHRFDMKKDFMNIFMKTSSRLILLRSTLRMPLLSPKNVRK